MQLASVTLHVVHHVVDGYEPFATQTTEVGLLQLVNLTVYN